MTPCKRWHGEGIVIITAVVRVRQQKNSFDTDHKQLIDPLYNFSLFLVYMGIMYIGLVEGNIKNLFFHTHIHQPWRRRQWYNWSMAKDGRGQ